MDHSAAASLIYKLLALPVLISSLELLFLVGRGEFAAGGLWDWRVISAATAPRSNKVDFLFKKTDSETCLLLLRITAAAAVLVFPWGSPFASLSLICLTATQFALNTRMVWGDDGADQMQSIVLVAMT